MMGKDYEIDFKTNKQKNLSTDYERNIRRLKKDD